MQNSLEILLQQLQDAELGGFDAQKDYAPPYRSLLTQEEILAKNPKYAAVNILLYPKTENGTFRSSTERTMKRQTFWADFASWW